MLLRVLYEEQRRYRVRGSFRIYICICSKQDIVQNTSIHVIPPNLFRYTPTQTVFPICSVNSILGRPELQNNVSTWNFTSSNGCNVADHEHAKRFG